MMINLMLKKTMIINAVIRAGIMLCLGFVSTFALPGAYAQEPHIALVDIEEVRWKTESQVRELLGEPLSIHGPTGTHATYTLWKYEGFTVAFSNQRVFHLFNKDSLKKFELVEDR